MPKRTRGEGTLPVLALFVLLLMLIFPSHGFAAPKAKAKAGPGSLTKLGLSLDKSVTRSKSVLEGTKTSLLKSDGILKQIDIVRIRMRRKG